MDGAASEAVLGLKAEKDSDLEIIWEALARRFGFVDEPERAMRRFDVCKQLEGERLWLSLNRACACCIGKLGPRQISNHLRLILFYVVSS